MYHDDNRFDGCSIMQGYTVSFSSVAIIFLYAAPTYMLGIVSDALATPLFRGHAAATNCHYMHVHDRVPKFWVFDEKALPGQVPLICRLEESRSVVVASIQGALEEVPPASRLRRVLGTGHDAWVCPGEGPSLAVTSGPGMRSMARSPLRRVAASSVRRFASKSSPDTT